ncbi:MAG: hypothetical protein WBW33_01025 [Bryobacteraceae bacterium]
MTPAQLVALLSEMVVLLAQLKLGLGPPQEATCTRSLCPDGTLWEVVRLDKIGEGGEQPTDAELNTWIAGFPIEPLQGGQGFTQQDSRAATRTT